MLTRISVGRSNITPRTLLVSLYFLVVVGCRSSRVAGVGASASRLSRFFPSQSALYDGCVVFVVHVLPCFKAPWSLEIRLVS